MGYLVPVLRQQPSCFSTPPEDKARGVQLLARLQPEGSSGSAGSEPHPPASATRAPERLDLPLHELQPAAPRRVLAPTGA